MPKPGDRLVIETNKLGAPRREGQLVEQIGSLMKVRWTDGTESLLTPGAGTVRFETGGKARKTTKAAAPTTKTPAAKAAPKKAVADKRPAAAKKPKTAAKATAKAGSTGKKKKS